MGKAFYIFAMPLAACLAKSYDRGVPVREVQIEAARNAKTKAEIKAALGSPAATNMAGDKWFYFHAEGRVLAFFDPYFKKYQIIAVKFGKGDNVDDVRIADIKDANFSTDPRSTSMDEMEGGFFSELFGNVGSVNMGGIGVGDMLGPSSESDRIVDRN
jgi:outer membrane protein assembly factor BamE (lipoprotein component of BamABCDE complex)